MYLGHQMDLEGLHATADKVEVMVRPPIPKNVQELHSFLGLLNYYRKVLSSLAFLLQPLNSLLQQRCNWKWNPECTKVLKLRKILYSQQWLLAYYDLILPLQLAADASAYDLGVLLSHILPDRLEHPIAFVSRCATLLKLRGGIGFGV